MDKIVEAFHPYIAPHAHFDLVLSKYGPVYVYPVDRKGECHEAEVLDSPKRVVEEIAFQMVCDQMEGTSLDRTAPTEEEKETVRTRFHSFVDGSEFATESMAMLESYLNSWK